MQRTSGSLEVFIIVVEDEIWLNYREDVSLKKFTYKNHPKGCSIDNGMKQTLVANRDFLILAAGHLENLLRNSISLISIDLLEGADFSENSDRDNNNRPLLYPRFFNKISKPLKLCNPNVCEIKVYFSTHIIMEPILSFMTCLNPSQLKKIILLTSVQEAKLDVTGLTSLTQWRKAHTVIMNDFFITADICDFVNFSEARITLDKISLDNLKFLKQHFTSNSINPFNIAISYRQRSNEHIDEIFGKPLIDQDQNNELGIQQWTFEIKSSDYDLLIEHIETSTLPMFIFSSVPSKKTLIHFQSPFGSLNSVFSNPKLFKLILERIPLPALFVLRQVSKQLRQFVDFLNFEINIQKLHIIIQPDLLSLKVSQFSRWYSKETVLHGGASDPLERFILDLGLILKNQKQCIEVFTCLISYTETVFEACDHVEKLTRALMARGCWIKVKSLQLKTRTQADFVSILSCFDSDYLKTVELGNDISTDKVLKTNDIVKLDQWKNAEKLVSTCRVKIVNFKHLSHFLNVEITVESVEFEDLDVLKQAFIESEATKKYLIICDNFELEQLYEKFGRPIIEIVDQIKHRKWFFKSNNGNALAIYIHIREDGKTCIQMHHENASIVPVDLLIK
ncbi:F-box domain-containing protein [Caenorhabditis elegans]|uniref:F-box domain-containing protein n=1 Tax=Caenorhabditis elegans TaxID=6239 RepID=O62361_CAEEL|nr:F-box domain-containing protein [Caenorhabditis elegans]CAB03320.3 F-box domain-containing protein [Caenorhabditis elegans]|eukprot:NP_506829.3 F-box A protein [Caenorhabditis elegans]